MLKNLGRRLFVLAASFALFAGVLPASFDVAHALPVIENVENEALPAGATFEQVEQSVLTALTSRGWQIVSRSEGAVEAQYARRDFSVNIRVSYTASTFSVIYLDSVGLRYDPEDQTIHRNYNRWISNLRVDIARYVQNATMGAPIG